MALLLEVISEKSQHPFVSILGIRWPIASLVIRVLKSVPCVGVDLYIDRLT
jgi:hypothetical protein